MREKKKIIPATKAQLHPRNRNRERYDFSALTKACPDLKPFVRPNPYGTESIDFADPRAVKTLNKAILKLNYQLNYWDIPAGYLCPPIPGRADYIHYAADLLADLSRQILPGNTKVRCLDVGTGANCIYPILGSMEYGWNFVGSDIDKKALQSAQKIVTQNSQLADKIALRYQENSKQIFTGIITPDEQFDLTFCNPPFHASAQAAAEGTRRKNRNLKLKARGKNNLNFGGQSNELWCEGGEEAFLIQMIRESKQFATNCLWFTSLVSKSERLPALKATLEKQQAQDVKIINMAQGNKISRVLAWTFLTPEQQKNWAKRWE